jgi:hypothetical protein
MLNRQNKLSLAAMAVMTLFSGAVIAQLPAGPQKAVPSAAQTAQRVAPSNAAGMVAPTTESSAAKEEVKPRNPLEEISRLNSEIGSLKAKLQIADIKSQIKKKEDEMNPPAPKVVEKEKREEPRIVKKEESKPNLPPLPNLNSLLNPSSAQGGNSGGQQGQAVSQQGQGASSTKPATKMDPQVLAVEGFGDDLKAELITDWGGWAVVSVGDKYYDWKVDEIKVSGVVLTKGSTRMQVAMTNSKVSKLQMQAMQSRSMPQGGMAGMGAGAMGGMGGGMMGAPVGMSPGGFGGGMPTDGGMAPGMMPTASPVIPNAMGIGSNTPISEASRAPSGALPGASPLLGGPPAQSPF